MSREKISIDHNYTTNYNHLCISARGGYASRKMHSLLEKNVEQVYFNKVLEVGAHFGEHQKFVKHKYSEYVMCDLVLPDKHILNSLDSRTRFQIGDVCSLQFDSHAFDRVISTCVLHHVDYPEKALQEMLRVTKKGGIISILLPTDPGMLYRLIKELTSGIRARRHGLYSEMKIFHAREHRNHFSSLITLIKEVYSLENVVINYWPFKFPNWNFEIFVTIKVEKSA